MKRNKTISILYYISAISFNLAAFINFASGNQNCMAVVQLGLGLTFLSLGLLYSKKSKENEDDREKKN